MPKGCSRCLKQRVCSWEEEEKGGRKGHLDLELISCLQYVSPTTGEALGTLWSHLMGNPRRFPAKEQEIDLTGNLVLRYSY